MTVRVLVVDDIAANVKLLAARLAAETFDVLTASNGPDALAICAQHNVDVVLLDVMMPGMDGFEVCRRIKAEPRTHHLPVVMVTALDQARDRIQGLEAGADDFLTKPVDDVALVTRVKNLARLKRLTDEMALRAVTSRSLGLPETSALVHAVATDGGRVLIIDDHPRSGTRLVEALAHHMEAVAEADPDVALGRLANEAFDVVLVSLSLQRCDGLRLCAQLRALDATRHLPIVILVEPGDEARMMRGLDMGLNDYLMRPVERHELLARVRTQVKRRRHSDYLRSCVDGLSELSVIDKATGLHNRRYLETHLTTILARAAAQGQPVSVLIADIDHLRQINDTFGYDAGDAVLREFARRLRRNTRGNDLAGRFGGEEFLIIMPDTEMRRGYQVAERLRCCVAAEPFLLPNDQRLEVTTSVGIAALERADDSRQALIARADRALQAAKRSGRNRVEAEAA